MRALWLALLLACGGSDRQVDAPLPEPQVLQGWPPLPIALGETSAAFRDLWEMAHDLPALRGPRGGPVPEWLREVYEPWIDDRAEKLERANRARAALRDEPAEERALGAALHAFLLGDTAGRLAGLRRGLSVEERRAVHGPVESLRARSLAAYQVCFELGLEGPHLDGWRRACADRLARLDAEVGETVSSSGDR